MARNQTLPRLWLLSDARNDHALDAALARLPRGSGFVYRHYHLHGEARRQRFRILAGIAETFGHVVTVSGSTDLAERWGADAVYGPTKRIAGATTMRKLATAHDRAQIAAATRARVDGIFLSPVFPTRSHADARPLGSERFRELAAQTDIPVIALGGITHASAQALDWPRWGAIDGLSFQQDS
ncbi:MAG: thiamine phosphate synthase [Pontixanthobacter sp.]